MERKDEQERSGFAGLNRRQLGRFAVGLAALRGRAAAQATAVPTPIPTQIPDPYFASFSPLSAPSDPILTLNSGDSVALCGDSITEAMQYARIVETYMTVCMPQLGIEFRNCGKGGETAPAFLARMRNEVLRFKPSVATLCYGMNDSGYTFSNTSITQTFHDALAAVTQNFLAANVRVLVGSSSCFGMVPPWDWLKQQGIDDVQLNQNLCALRDQAVTIATQLGLPYADVFWTMFTARYYSLQRRGSSYALCGTADGVHPDWAGHLVMAYAFLSRIGLDGNLGTISIDLNAGTASAGGGHEVRNNINGAVTILSSRYPFCADGPVDRYNSVRSGMEFVPFHRELNRLMLTVNGPASEYTITWGPATRSYQTADLQAGINLAEEFCPTPFQTAFEAVDAAVLAKQTVEGELIWNVFVPGRGEADIAYFEALRSQALKAIQAAFVPVTHTIYIEPLSAKARRRPGPRPMSQPMTQLPG